MFHPDYVPAYRQRTLAELQDQFLTANEHLDADCALQVGVVQLNLGGHALSQSIRHHEDDPQSYLTAMASVFRGLTMICSSTGIGLDEVAHLALAEAKARQAKAYGPSKPPARPSFLPFRR